LRGPLTLGPLYVPPHSFKAFGNVTPCLFVDQAREIFDPCWRAGEPADDEGCDMDDNEYRQFIALYDPTDL
jgi:hypothetical protein